MSMKPGEKIVLSVAYDWSSETAIACSSGDDDCQYEDMQVAAAGLHFYSGSMRPVQFTVEVTIPLPAPVQGKVS